MDKRYVFHTPLMWIDKAATWDLAHDLGGEKLVDLIRFETHTCYKGDRSTLRDWGYGCANCPACELRAAGWNIFADRRPNSTSKPTKNPEN
jgi:7-cyano-7-deazaguanine synthase